MDNNEEKAEWQAFEVFVFGFESNGLGVTDNKCHPNKTHIKPHVSTHNKTQYNLAGDVID